MSKRPPIVQLLVVDDNDEFRSAFCDLLVLEGYHPIACRSGESAWTQLSAGLRPAAIIVDLALPRMSGREFLKLIRSTSWGLEIPVLLLSAWHGLESFSAQADRVLGKYTEPLSIVRTIDRLTVHST